jgi:hypothetical protein
VRPQAAPARLSVDAVPEGLGLLAPGAITRRAPRQMRAPRLGIDPQPRPQRRDRAHLYFVPAIFMGRLHAIHRDGQHARVGRCRRRDRPPLPHGLHVGLLIGLGHRAEAFRVAPRCLVGDTHAERVPRRIHCHLEGRLDAQATHRPIQGRRERPRAEPDPHVERRLSASARVAEVVGPFDRVVAHHALDVPRARPIHAPHYPAALRAKEAVWALARCPVRQHPLDYLPQDHPPHRLQPPFNAIQRGGTHLRRRLPQRRLEECSHLVYAVLGQVCAVHRYPPQAHCRRFTARARSEGTFSALSLLWGTPRAYRV